MYSNNGNYTVKSGYEALQSWKNNSNPGPSTSSQNNNIWKKLWALHTIPRHKMIVWRILHNTLPVRTELNKRGVNCPPLCPRCYSNLETTNHIFMSCERTQRVWFGSQLSIRFPDNSTINFSDWLFDAISNQTEEIIIKISAITYSIWHARNKAIFENQFVSEDTIIQ